MFKALTIFHIITGLGNGGAEGVLYRLCTKDKKYRHIVISLTTGGKYKTLLEKKNIKVLSCNFKKTKLNIKEFYKILKLFDYYKPDIIQGWMYHGDLIASVISLLKKNKNLYWNIRNSTLDKKARNFITTFLTMKFCALISHKLPKKIICCSNNSINYHISQGYKKSIFEYLPNGINTDVFKPNKLFKTQIKRKLNIKNNLFIFGTVARFDEQKDHKTLIMALKLLKQKSKDFKVLLIGKDLTNKNHKIVRLIDEYSLRENILLLGEREEINELMCFIDCHVLSSSYGEAFPNVIAEAMACSTPCIATNVGDSKNIIGKFGWTTDSKDPISLSQKMYHVMNLQKNDLLKMGQLARDRIIDLYSLDRMVSSYQNIYEK